MMQTRRRELLRLSTVAGGALLTGCFGDDEPDETETTGEDDETESHEVPDGEWPSYQRTAGNTGDAAGTTVAAEPTETWRVSLSGGVHEQPVVCDGRVYALTDDGVLEARSLDSGDHLWETDLGSVDPQCPAVVDGVVVAGADTGELVGLDATSGQQEWTVDLAGAVVGSTPFGDLVYAGTDSGTVVGIDANSGERELETDVGDPVTTQPVVTRDRLYLGVGEGAFSTALGLDRASGEVRWRVENKIFQNVAATNGTVYLNNGTGTMHFQTDGTGRGSSTGPAMPAIRPDAAYYGGEIIREHRRSDSGEEWQAFVEELLDDPAHVTGTMCATDEHLFCTYVEFETDGEFFGLFGFDIESGTHTWSWELPAGAPRGPVVAEGTLLLGTSQGDLVAFE